MRVHSRVPRPHLSRPRQGRDRQRLNGRSGILASHLNFGDPRRGWDFRSPGRGGVNFEEIIRALNDIGYTGSAVGRMGRQRHGPRPSARARPASSPRSSTSRPARVAFDAAFDEVIDDPLVNGRAVSNAEPMTVEQVLDTVDVPPNYLAVELNAEVVPREEYASSHGSKRVTSRTRHAGRRRLILTSWLLANSARLAYRRSSRVLRATPLRPRSLRP